MIGQNVNIQIIIKVQIH